MSGPPCIYGAKTVNRIWRSCVVPLLIPSHFHVKKQLKTYNVNEEQRFCEFTPVPVIMTVTWQTTSPFAYLILRDFPELIWTKQLSGWPWGAYPQPTGNLSHPSAIKSYMLVLCFLEQITIHIHNPQCNLSYPNFWSQSHHTVHAKIIFQHFDIWTLSTQLHSILEKVKTKEWWYLST